MCCRIKQSQAAAGKATKERKLIDDPVQGLLVACFMYVHIRTDNTYTHVYNTLIYAQAQRGTCKMTHMHACTPTQLLWRPMMPTLWIESTTIAWWETLLCQHVSLWCFIFSVFNFQTCVMINHQCIFFFFSKRLVNMSSVTNMNVVWTQNSHERIIFYWGCF